MKQETNMIQDKKVFKNQDIVLNVSPNIDPDNRGYWKVL